MPLRRIDLRIVLDTTLRALANRATIVSVHEVIYPHALPPSDVSQDDDDDWCFRAAKVRAAVLGATAEVICVHNGYSRS